MLVQFYDCVALQFFAGHRDGAQGTRIYSQHANKQILKLPPANRIHMDGIMEVFLVELIEIAKIKVCGITFHTD